MRVVIDHDRCSGHGRCYVIAPALFGDDDAGYGQTIGDGFVSAELEPAARSAAIGCPERAITLLEDAG